MRWETGHFLPGTLKLLLEIAAEKKMDLNLPLQTILKMYFFYSVRLKVYANV